MALKFSPIVLVSMLIVMLAVADYTSAASAAELRPQRRRRPSPADADLDGASVTSSARRLNTKLTNSGRTSFNWDIEQSCLAEPGCEWSCQDSYECNCRCKFEDPQVANIRWPSGLSSRLWWN